MNMEMVLKEELRPAIYTGSDFYLKVLVHTTNKDKNGYYLTEMKDGSLAYSDPRHMIFLDSEKEFNEFSWNTGGSYVEQLKQLPTFETIKEVISWLNDND